MKLIVQRYIKQKTHWYGFFASRKVNIFFVNAKLELEDSERELLKKFSYAPAWGFKVKKGITGGLRIIMGNYKGFGWEGRALYRPWVLNEHKVSLGELLAGFESHPIADVDEVISLEKQFVENLKALKSHFPEWEKFERNESYDI